ncbi:MAG: COX15/CtaA family protein, partial [Verrucomicrobiota bacterium]
PGEVSEIDASVYDISQFNKVKMWIEYINRLIGVLVGLFILGTTILSIPFWKKDRPVVLGSVASLILVIFQGWLGGRVVKSGLEGGTITLHMIVAVLLLSLLVWVTYRASASTRGFTIAPDYRKQLRIATGAFFFLCAIQVVTGSQVRESVDLIHANHASEIDRADWLEHIGNLFKWHRSAAWLLAAGGLGLAWIGVRGRIAGAGRRTLLAVVALVALQFVTGAALAWFALPRPFQILHLGLSSLLVCATFLLIVGLRKNDS